MLWDANQHLFAFVFADESLKRKGDEAEEKPEVPEKKAKTDVEEAAVVEAAEEAEATA